MANEKGPNVKKKQKCKNCEGKGLLKKGDKVVKCQRCGGTGLRGGVLHNFSTSFRDGPKDQTRNLEIPRCAIAHLRFDASHRPGMT